MKNQRNDSKVDEYLERNPFAEFLQVGNGIFITIATIAVAIPFVTSHDQLITGSLVNCLLLLAATRLPKVSQRATVSVLPSMSALIQGLLLGPLTPLLFFMLPAVWAGNITLVEAFRQTKWQRATWRKALTVAASIGGKLTVISVYSAVLVATGMLPVFLLPRFTTLQLFTMVTGLILATLGTALHLVLRKKHGGMKHE